jgi:hypothetical protein
MVRGLCVPGEITEYEIFFECLFLANEGTLLLVEYTFSSGTADHSSPSGT